MNENRIRIGFSSFPDYSGNCKALYEELVKRNLNNLELIWFVKEKEIKEKLKEKEINVVCDKEENFMDEFNKTEFIFITHADYINIKLDRQTFISLWHGVGPKKAANMLKNGKEFAKEYKEKIDYMIAPSEIAKSIFSYTFNKKTDDIFVYPQARYKYLIESNGKENLEKLLKINLYKFKKIIMYSPTFRVGLGENNGIYSSNNLLNLKKYEEENLVKFLKDNNYLLILKLHPSEENKIDTSKLNENIVLLKDDDMLKNFITINEVLNAVDLMITDYSSIYVDYINLLRPVAFINTDVNEYLEDRGFVFNSTDLWWFPGPKINELQQFKYEVEKLLNDENYFKEDRINFNNLLNESKDLSCDKLIDEFVLKLKPKIKIPKIIHYFKKEKYNKKELENIKEWKDALKDYEIKEWDINSNEINKIVDNENIDKNNITLLKLVILNKYGGVFLKPEIQVLKDFEDLLIKDDKIIIKDGYGKCINSVIGSSKENDFIKDRINIKWFGISNNENINSYKMKNLFVSAEEQWRIGQETFQDTDKFFNNTNISLKNKIGRALKYGFLMKY